MDGITLNLLRGVLYGGITLLQGVLYRGAIYIKRAWTEVHVRIIPQGDSAWLCAYKSAGMRVSDE